MIVDMVRLGYLKDTDSVLDPTYGTGRWWKKWRPEKFTYRTHAAGFDFRNTIFYDNEFDAVAYDPPYVCIGGRKTSGIKSMYDGYGLTDAPTTPQALQLLINAGLSEMMRVVKPRGIILVKCQDYVSSGKLYPGTFNTQYWAGIIGLELVDRFEHIGNPRPQPPGRRQVHARRNLSTLFVFRKP
jgi:tRNA G10  N-methylase Trm11